MFVSNIPPTAMIIRRQVQCYESELNVGEAWDQIHDPSLHREDLSDNKGVHGVILHLQTGCHKVIA